MQVKPVEDYAAKTLTYKGNYMSFWLMVSQPYFIKRLQWNRSEHWNGKFYWKWYEMINPFCTYQSIQAKIKSHWEGLKANKPKPKVLKFKGR